MDKKLHIKAVAGSNVKVDAYWYSYGDEIDCYLTPQQFKDYVKGFLDFDILLDDGNSPKSIELPKEEVIIHEPIQETVRSEGSSARKGTKKATV